MTAHNAKEDYLRQLERELGAHSQKESILFDYDLHISQLLHEYEQQTDEDWMSIIRERIGTPQEVAIMWQEELSVTRNKTLTHFLLLNVCFFLAGGLLTLVHFVHDAWWIRQVWSMLTSIPAAIMVLYMMFWALLGYEIGKSFGAGGRSLLRKTFLVSLVPNVTLMMLVVFRIIPHEWFQPLLSQTFILYCIAGTILLYPICWIGYRWGKKQSI